MLKIDIKNTKTLYEICSKLTKKILEWTHWCQWGRVVYSEAVACRCSILQNFTKFTERLHCKCFLVKFAILFSVIR